MQIIDNAIEQLEKVLHNEIPLTNEIGIKVEKYDNFSLSISAPLSVNYNHKKTAFGGSLYCVAVLSGWGLIYLALKENNLSGQIVIQESNTKFIRPVKSNLLSTSTFESKTQYMNFINKYKRRGIARIKLNSNIMLNDEVCVNFQGTYVVQSEKYLKN